MTPEPDRPDRLDEAVRKRCERRARWKREGERSIGQNLALIGVLGWTIVTPTLIKLSPPRTVIVGNLSDTRTVLEALGLRAEAEGEGS